MRLDLSLRDLEAPRLNEALLRRPSRTLHEIKTRNEARWVQGSTSKEFQNRKARLRKRLQAAARKGEQFSQIVKTDVGWQRLLLSIYLDDLGEEWLPAFDRSVAADVLGKAGEPWHASRRRQVTQFFFHHFDLIDDLAFVCGRLRESYVAVDAEPDSPVFPWAMNRAVLFDPSGPANVAAQARQGETLDSLRERLAVPQTGRFSEVLKNLFLLRRLESEPIGEADDVLKQIETMREEEARLGVPMGAAALEIMTKRVCRAGREWPETWSDWILRLGCDPGLPERSEQVRKWWLCWSPSPQELESARQAINRKTIEYFIRFLEASLLHTPQFEQFESRAHFLRQLHACGKIQRFKLLLHPDQFRQLPAQYKKQPHRIARVADATQDKSIIFMECIDDMVVVEGTSIFAVRALRKNRFPHRVMESDQLQFPFIWFTEGVMHRDACPVWQKHSGDWVGLFCQKLANALHVEWGDLA